MNIQIQAKQYTNAAEMLQEAKRLRDRFYKPDPKRKEPPTPREEIYHLREKLAAAEHRAREAENELDEVQGKIIGLERLLDFMRGELVRFAGDVASTESEGDLFKARPTIKDICIDVLREFPGVNFNDLLGDSRGFYIVEARHACIYEVKKRRPDISFPMIGRALNRDHTSILHAYRKMKKLDDERAKEAAE